MAMFDGDLVTVTTPDGRTVQMPSSLAASFPALQVQPPATTDAPIADAPAAPATPDLPPPEASFAPPTPAPSPAPAPAPNAPPPPSDSGPVTSPGADQGTQAVAPPPQAPPVTNAQLLKEGAAGILNRQNRALDQEAAVNTQQGQLEATAADREAKRLAQRDQETAAINAERAQAFQRMQADIDARMAKRDQLADQIAKARIDRSIDNPIWASIGLIMSTIGTAMKTRPGDKWDDPAYNTLMQQLDRKVQAQMQDLDQKRAALAQMNTGIAEARQNRQDRMAEIDVRKDAAIQQAQQAVQTMAAQLKSPAAILGAQKLNAKLEEDRTALRANAFKSVQDQVNTEHAQAQAMQIHRESMALQRRGQDITIRGQDLQERERLAAIAEKALEKKDKVTAERIKKIQELGVSDPRTGQYILDKDGQTKSAQADAIEAQARKNPYQAGLAYVKSLREQATSDDDKRQIDAIEARVRTDPQFAAQAARQYAKGLREDALVNNAVTAPSAERGKELAKELSAAQAITDHIGDAISKLEAGPSATSREEWSALKTELSHIAGRYQQALGERPSVKAFEQTVDHILNFDPDSIFQREASRGKAIASLKQLKQLIATNTDTSLKGNHINAGWLPQTKEESGIGLNLGEKTAAERSDDEMPGWIGRNITNPIRADIHAISPFNNDPLTWQNWNKIASGEADQEAAFADASSRKGSEAGLSPNAVTHIKALVKKADSAGDADRARYIAALAAPVTSGLAEGGRTSLAIGALQVIQASDPSVYSEVVASLPESMQQQIAESSVNSGVGAIPGRLPPSRFSPDAAASASSLREQRENEEMLKRLRIPETRASVGTPRDLLNALTGRRYIEGKQ